MLDRNGRDPLGLGRPPAATLRLRYVEAIRDELGARVGRALLDENDGKAAHRRQTLKALAQRAAKGRPGTPGKVQAKCVGGRRHHVWAMLDRKQEIVYCPRCGIQAQHLQSLYPKELPRDRALAVSPTAGRYSRYTKVHGAARQAVGEALAERYGGWRCFYCARRLADDEWTLDHYVPRAKGGSDDLDNLRLACGPCNTRKKDRLPPGVTLDNGRYGLPLSLGVKKGRVRA